MNGKNFLLKGMWFFEYWSHMMCHYPVKFGVHRTCGIGIRTFFICHETTYNPVIKLLCDFVHGDPIPWAITLSSFVVMRHVKKEIYICLFVTQLLCYVTIVGGDPFSKAIIISSLDILSRKFKYNAFYLSRDLTWPHEQKDRWLLSLWIFIIRHYLV